MRINHNIPALNAHRILSRNNNTSSDIMERLSSGRRINRAKDDAAGMAISEKMKTQIRGLRKASQNTLDGISLIQTAEGAMNEVHSMLQRMRELSVQSANGTTTDDDREAIQAEVNQLTSEVNRIANGTEFNTRNLLKGNEGPNSNTTVHRMSTGSPAVLTGELKGDIESQKVDITIDGETRTVILTGDADDADDRAKMIENMNEAIRGLGTIIEDNNGNFEIRSNSVGGSSEIVLESTALTDDTAVANGIFVTDAENGKASARGDAENDSDVASGAINFTARPEAGSTITIGKEKIEFFDSSTGPYTGANRPIDIWDGTGYKEASGIAGEIAGMAFDGIDSIVVDDNVDTRLILTADKPGFEGQRVFIEGTPDEFVANLQIGPNQGQGFRLVVGDIRATELRISSTRPDGATGVRGAEFFKDPGVTDGLTDELNEYALDVSSEETATAAITVYNNAIVHVAQLRGELGAIQNRLEYTSANLDNTQENMTAALSRIEDADMALEMSEFTKMNVMMQAGTSMLAQANQQPQMVLQLLQG